MNLVQDKTSPTVKIDPSREIIEGGRRIMQMLKAAPPPPVPEAALDNYHEWEAEYERERKQEELRYQQKARQCAAEELEERQNAESYALLFAQDDTDNVPNTVLDQWREDSQDQSFEHGLSFSRPSTRQPWEDYFTPEEYAQTMAETEAFFEDARECMRLLRG